MDLKRLRQETAAEHAGTEETVPLMRESLTRAQYADCLQRFYRVAYAWDRWADAHVPDDLRALLAGRRRAELLADDLVSIGEAPPVPERFHRMDVTVAGEPRLIFLGRMYVMEGSTLGGQYIAKHVEEKLALTPSKGDSYFVGYGDDTGARWQEFRAVLAELPESDADTVIASAKEMFTIFGEAMRGG